jgi:glycogen debranching enzyme
VSWSEIYLQVGDPEKSEHCKERANSLRSQFLKTFWISEEHTIAEALDLDKCPVGSVTSNMGQVLWSGILPVEYAQLVTERLMSPDMFNGFGIRTMSSSEFAYNPMSYHNGSVWPHDNSLILAGFQVYEQTEAIATLIQGLLYSASTFPLFRLPELFCGFGDSEVEAPVPYPVSCSPQAWAAATPMLALQTLLGISPDVPQGRVILHPVLPAGVDELYVRHLCLGQGELDIHLVRTGDASTAMTLEKNTTGLEIQVLRKINGGHK